MNTEQDTKAPTESEVFDYLEELKEADPHYMFGATPYIVDHFGSDIIDFDTAKEYLIKWMNKEIKSGIL